MTRVVRLISFALTIGASACATHQAAPGDADLSWAANGYRSPGRADDPELIGAYASKKECEGALEEWMSRQVVGNPVSGECLPVDRH